MHLEWAEGSLSLKNMSAQKSKNVDYLIMGQGLAGSILAYKLSKKNSILVIDNANTSSASRVAGGLLNPITGRRMVINENLDALLPCSIDFYQTLEKEFNDTFFYKRNILRLCNKEKDKTVLEKRYNDPEYQPYLGETFKENTFTELKDDKGSFEIINGGFIDTRNFLDNCKQYFKDKESYIENQIQYNDINVSEDCIQWKHIKAKNIIFCEGYKISENPWFQDLNLNPVKGDILTIKLEKELTEKITSRIISKGKWIIPLDKNTAKVGSTYTRESLDEIPTKEGKEEVLDALANILELKNNSIEVIEHKASVRPYTEDMKPIMKPHSEHKNMFIFNGFGSKGSLLIPLLADKFMSTL